MVAGAALMVMALEYCYCWWPLPAVAMVIAALMMDMVSVARPFEGGAQLSISFFFFFALHLDTVFWHVVSLPILCPKEMFNIRCNEGMKWEIRDREMNKKSKWKRNRKRARTKKKTEIESGDRRIMHFKICIRWNCNAKAKIRDLPAFIWRYWSEILCTISFVPALLQGMKSQKLTS